MGAGRAHQVGGATVGWLLMRCMIPEPNSSRSGTEASPSSCGRGWKTVGISPSDLSAALANILKSGYGAFLLRRMRMPKTDVEGRVEQVDPPKVKRPPTSTMVAEKPES